ncbi:MAG: DUF402 domain-containing protein [Clostridia bacterium]|nr:DUF402 domain-containing protein [Clostridia bacterium]
MKRKRLSYDTWKCITRREILCRRIAVQGFEGHACLIRIRRVTEPQYWRVQGRMTVVAEEGMSWLCLLPDRENWCVTAMLDQQDGVILWYIDMIADKGLCVDGMPWFDDLYLDLVVKPDGYIHEDDRDELDAALRMGDITPEQHRLALDTAHTLKNGLLKDLPSLEALTRRCLDFVLAK